MWNQNLVKIEIPECPEEAEFSAFPQMGVVPKKQTRLEQYHGMLSDYYDSNKQSVLKKDMLKVDIANPQFTFEFANEF